MNLVFIFHTWSFSSLSLFFALLFQCATGRQLKFSVVVYRHGDRSPLSNTFKNMREDDWPRGYGQLTKIGTQQAYSVGQFLKKRYKTFLSPSYKPNEIYVRSTDYDRTLMSAAATLAGLYPPTPKEQWNPAIRWQPIPVHTVPVSEEKLLKYPNSNQRFIELLQKYKEAAKSTNGFKRTLMLLQKISSIMGYNPQEMLNFENKLLWNTYDTLKVQKIHKKPIPSWATEKTVQQLKSIIENFIVKAMEEPLKNEKSQLQGGILVNHILKKLINATKFNDGQKMIMYSAHDMTIIFLQIALGVFNNLLPPYSAMHIFELYKEDSGQVLIHRYNNHDLLNKILHTVNIFTFSKYTAFNLQEHINLEDRKMLVALILCDLYFYVPPPQY